MYLSNFYVFDEILEDCSLSSMFLVRKITKDGTYLQGVERGETSIN